MQNIVTVSMHPTLDKSTTIDNVVPEHKLRCQAVRYEPGGGGINVSRAIKKLGGYSQAYYLCGGLTGKFLRKLLDKEGLSHHPILISGCTGESLSVFENTTNQQYRFSLPGPTVQTEEWQQCLTKIAALDPPPAYLVASGSLPPGVPADFYARLANLAHTYKCRFVLDTSSIEAMRLALREGVYLIKPNLRECRKLVGNGLERESEQNAQIMKIIEQGQSKVVVVSLGAAGIILASQEGCERLRAPTVPIKSKVGAGDSMVAGIIIGLAQGKPFKAAVRFGVAAGTAAVITPGSELCRREDTERLYETML